MDTHATTEDLMFSVLEFCRKAKISRTVFYELEKKRLAPKSILLGRRRLIPAKAAHAWIDELLAKEGPI